MLSVASWSLRRGGGPAHARSEREVAIDFPEFPISRVIDCTSSSILHSPSSVQSSFFTLRRGARRNFHRAVGPAQCASNSDPVCVLTFQDDSVTATSAKQDQAWSGLFFPTHASFYLQGIAFTPVLDLEAVLGRWPSDVQHASLRSVDMPSFRSSRRVTGLKDSDYDHEISLVNHDDRIASSSIETPGEAPRTSTGSRLLRDEDHDGIHGASLDEAHDTDCNVHQDTRSRQSIEQEQTLQPKTTNQRSASTLEPRITTATAPSIEVEGKHLNCPVQGWDKS